MSDEPGSAEEALEEALSDPKRTDRLTEGADSLESDGLFGKALEIFTGGLTRASMPEVVCLCGSTRFKDEYLEAQERLTLEGKIFLTVGFFGHADGMPDDADKDELDELHKRKIDLADRIHVINPGGYVGRSTRTEIAYARATDTSVSWMEPPDGTSRACYLCSTRDVDADMEREDDLRYHPECLETVGRGYHEGRER